MKFRFYLSALLLPTLAVPAAMLWATRPVLAAPKSAPCAVCSVKEGAGDEPVKATATYQGKEFYFCREECKTEFLKTPAAFLPKSDPSVAPAFTLNDLGGKPVSLSDYAGKVVLVDFWATFCGPCVKSMPRLQKLHDANAKKGFSVIGIATDEEGRRVVAPFVAKTKVQYPILISDANAWKNYGVETLPALFLIDRKGQIVKRFGGGTDHKVIEQAVRKALEE